MDNKKSTLIYQERIKYIKTPATVARNSDSAKKIFFNLETP